MTENQDIVPFIVYREQDDTAEIALWKLADDRRAVALFLDQESAQAYRETAELASDWRIFQPSRDALVALLESAEQGGVELAVLQPTAESAQRMWSIHEVLKQVGA